jgi:ligand-binding SRPBCC domain-containing protein
MSLHRFEAEQTLPIDLEEAWSFFSSPRNLAEITPPDMGFDVSSPLPDEMYSGLIVSYRVRPMLGIPVTWVTEIKHVEPLVRFVDEQRMGPYAFWHHQHFFEAVPGGTRMRDIVHYSVPFGPLGDAVNAILIAPRVRGIFDYRSQVLTERFGSAGASAGGTEPGAGPSVELSGASR